MHPVRLPNFRPLRFRPSRCVILGSALVGLCALTTAHGIFEKPLYNKKTNYATRGSAPGTQPARLYYMQPQRYLHGEHEVVGWRTVMQDEKAETQEFVEFSYVKFAADGVSPDTSATGTIFKTQFRLFGLGLKGTTAFDFTLTIGLPQPLPVHHGIGVRIAANKTWPKDGASIHGQLNIPNDSRRPRVPAPYDKQVWVFEQPNQASAPKPLGGRTLDTLDLTSLYIEPVMQTWIRSKAYGLGTEELFGPEAMHPSATRGDELGLFINGGQIGADGWGLVLVAPQLTSGKPIPFPRGSFYLGFQNGPPIQLLLAPLDSLGIVKTLPIPFSVFPKGFRKFWLQTVILNPFSGEVEATEAVGIAGI